MTDMRPDMEGPSYIEKPTEVTIKGDVVTAATAQDAINAAARENAKELKSGDTRKTKAKMLNFPGGLGFVATGASVYQTMADPTATRIAKRKAYLTAFTQAKRNLAEILGGLSNEAKETVREALTKINLPDEEMANISAGSEEALRQAISIMLRGFVIHEAHDDTSQDTVYVTIVTTPKTCGKLARPTPNAIKVNDLREGINQVISDVKTGLVPPVGGRIITVRSTSQTALVGFSSTIAYSSRNAAVQAKLDLSAQNIATMRAEDVLCGLIIGDRATWWSGVVESPKDEVKEFEPLAKDDPLAKNNLAGVKKLEQARQALMAKLKDTDIYHNARRGILPSDVDNQTWFDEDHAWAYGVSIYVPSLISAAAPITWTKRVVPVLKMLLTVAAIATVATIAYTIKTQFPRKGWAIPKAVPVYPQKKEAEGKTTKPDIVIPEEPPVRSPYRPNR